MVLIVYSKWVIMRYMGSKTNPEEYIGKTYGRLTVRSLNNVKPNMVKGKKYG